MPTTPTEIKPQYRDFDRFVALADEIVHHVDAVCALLDEEDLLDGGGMALAEELAAEWPKVAELLAKCAQADAFYDRREYYDNHGTEDEVIARGVVAEKVGMLLDGFEFLPRNAEVVVPLLIEEIIATEPNALVLESVCRQIRRMPKLRRIPEIGDILALLQQHRERWGERWECMRIAADRQQQLGAKISEAKGNGRLP